MGIKILSTAKICVTSPNFFLTISYWCIQSSRFCFTFYAKRMRRGATLWVIFRRIKISPRATTWVVSRHCHFTSGGVTGRSSSHCLMNRVSSKGKLAPRKDRCLTSAGKVFFWNSKKKKGYLSWWTQRIIDYLRDEAKGEFSIDDMSKDTAIRSVDIIYALEHSKLLKKHGIFSIGAKAKFFSR